MLTLHERPYSIPEEIVNTTTHVIGSHISAFLFGMLLLFNFTMPDAFLSKEMGCIIYGLSSIMMFMTSSLYHAVTHIPSKKLLKTLDHIAIYFLIVGTFAPLTLACVIPSFPILGWTFLGLQLASLIGGIGFKLFSKNRYSAISVMLYCIMGWSAIIILYPLIMTMSSAALFWFVMGGAMYTLGVPFYVLKQYKWTHCIWHIFVMLGIGCHYAMLFLI